MNPKRGDVVTVAASGDFGKPRPAVVIRSDVFPEQHASVIVCQMTSTLEDAPDFRVTIEPSRDNGLWAISQIMADKPRDGPAGEDRIANRPAGPARHDAFEQRARLRAGVGGLGRVNAIPRDSRNTASESMSCTRSGGFATGK